MENSQEYVMLVLQTTKPTRTWQVCYIGSRDECLAQGLEAAAQAVTNSILPRNPEWQLWAVVEH